MRPTDYFDRQIAFHREFVSITGSVCAALFLSQSLYWSKKTNFAPFYKTQEEWTEETGMSRAEQESARRKLKELGVLQERYERLEHRMYYRLDQDRLDELLQSRIPECGKPALGNAEIPHSCNSAEITTDIPPTPKGPDDFFGIPTQPPAKVQRKTPMMLRLDKLYRRKETDAWTKDEMKFFRAIGDITEDEMAAVEKHYAAMAKTPDKDYRKRELQRCLRHWRGVVDSARQHRPASCF